MTPIELISKLLEKDNYTLLIWLQFLAEKIDCKDCIQTRKESSGIPPDCSQCIPPKNLIKKNFRKKETI